MKNTKKEVTKKKVKYKKIGKCNQCGLCCLISHKGKQIVKDGEILDLIREGYKIVKSDKKMTYLAKWDPCQYLTFDLKCSIHGKPEQPTVCRVFPNHPHSFYKVVEKHCSIKFKRVK